VSADRATTFSTLGSLAGVDDGLPHPRGDVDVGLPPTRPEGIPQMSPGGRLTQHTITDTHPLTLKDVVRLDSQRLDSDVMTVQLCDRFGGLLGAFHR
jgi:hypothetical protein